MPEVVRAAVLPAFQLTDAQRALWATDTADESPPLEFLQSTHFVLDSLDEAEAEGEGEGGAGTVSEWLGCCTRTLLQCCLVTQRQLEPAGNETKPKPKSTTNNQQPNQNQNQKPKTKNQK